MLHGDWRVLLLVQTVPVQALQNPRQPCPSLVSHPLYLSSVSRIVTDWHLAFDRLKWAITIRCWELPPPYPRRLVPITVFV
jgi:hypothetical protein